MSQMDDVNNIYLISNIRKENIVSSFIPIVFLSIVVRSRSGIISFIFLESWLLALEVVRILEHFEFPVISILVLDFFDDVIIVEII